MAPPQRTFSPTPSGTWCAPSGATSTNNRTGTRDVPAVPGPLPAITPGAVERLSRLSRRSRSATATTVDSGGNGASNQSTSIAGSAEARAARSGGSGVSTMTPSLIGRVSEARSSARRLAGHSRRCVSSGSAVSSSA
ncbi:hypothetical protein GCM10007964_43960 [Sphaerisporangium melleum]|uniref:Uncharacterized protein n=1 Tax=Sphaerisporangium melleum TaxID=321316 RepID=A0A917R9J2_9ACTN|nr:hypothetical protein GCM10007964_43960 [Sphaerisporangium melleum]